MKKKILYFEKLDFQKESIRLIKRKFDLIPSKKIKKKDFSLIKSVFLPMNNYYSKQFFSKYKNLRSVISPTTGDIHLDRSYLRKKKIKLINLSKQKEILNNITATSEVTIGHIINLTRKILEIHNNFLYTKKFEKYNYLLSNKILTVGIVGMGRIGKHVAERSKGLGFNVIYFDPFVKDKRYKKIINFRNFLKKTNILTIHMHYKKKYHNKFNKNIFKLLRKPSYFVNTSRGEFVNESDLIKSLKNKTLTGAGLDVVKNEFKEKFRKSPKKNILYNFFIKNKKYNFFITPKQGGSNKSAWLITEKLLINQLIEYEKNKI